MWIIEVFTNSLKPVPWRLITADSSKFLEGGCIPAKIVVRDPSHMRLEDVNSLWYHWEIRSRENKKLVVFVKAKEMRSGMHEMSSKTTIMKKKPEYVEIDSDDAKDPSQVGYQSDTTTPSDDGLPMACPDNIPTRKHFNFLCKLSRDERYLDLIHALRDLATMTEQEVSGSQFYTFFWILILFSQLLQRRWTCPIGQDGLGGNHISLVTSIVHHPP